MRITDRLHPTERLRFPDDLDGTVIVPCAHTELAIPGAFVGPSSNPSSLLARLLAAQGCYDPESVLHDLRLNSGLMATLGVILPDERTPDADLAAKFRPGMTLGEAKALGTEVGS